MKRSRILILLSVLLVMAIGYAWYATPKQTKATAARPAESNRGSTALQNMQDPFPEVPDLNLSGDPITDYRPPANNLFGPVFAPPEKKPVKRTPPPPRLASAPAPKKIVKIPRPVQQPPLPKISVLGYLNKGQDTTVFLTTGPGEVHLVKAGESFADGLQIAALNAGQLKIVKSATGQSLVLPLGESRSQRLPDVKFQSGRPLYEPPPETETESSETKAAANPALKQQADQQYILE